MNILGIIPARYASTRFEGKPLEKIEGKSMIQHVYERCKEALEHVAVATDDLRIFQEVLGFGGTVLMTSPDHNTGTNRCLEAMEQYINDGHPEPDIVINVQGDEPLLDPEQIRTIIRCFDDPSVQLASLAIPVLHSGSVNHGEGVYVAMNLKKDALYFSRSVIPYLRDIPFSRWQAHHTFYKHVGMYAYTPEALRKFAAMDQTPLEKAESLEQNRWLENGNTIRMGITDHQSQAVDTPEDLERVRALFRNRPADKR